jgi:hypothetical protein
MNIFNKIFGAVPENKVLADKGGNIEPGSIEQIEFANGAIDIFNTVLKQHGFNLFKLNITEYSSTIIWIKGNCYVELGGITHPHDAPYYYGIALGEFKGDYYYYSETDCIGLWRLKAIQEPLDLIKDTPFPFKENIEPSLVQMRDDLLKYAKTFLEGDLSQFYHARENK